MDAIRPQPGPQTNFLLSSCDIVFYGGSAGSGKTFSLLMEACRNIAVPRYGAVIFRRTAPQITAEGSLWDSSHEIYPFLGGEPKKYNLTWVFPNKNSIKFSHLEYEKNIYDHQGAQYAFEGFDEVTHFTEKQFFYLMSRNRSTCGIRPYIRATCNPVPTGWVRELLDWWIGKDGFPIPERAGVTRYFTRKENKIIWVDENWRDEDNLKAKSLTFIPAKVDDNAILMKKNPEYKANLRALSRVDRMTLLDGNWNVKPDDSMFDPDWFKITDTRPQGIKWIRYWDRAATEVTAKNTDPDHTAGARCGMFNGNLYIGGMQRFRESPAKNEEKILYAAKRDGINVSIILEQEPGSAGKDTVDNYKRRVLKDYHVIPDRPTGDKVDRAKPWCAMAEKGQVYLIKGDWIDNFLAEVGSFPHGKKDQIDAVSGAYKYLTGFQRVIPAYNPYNEAQNTDFGIDWTNFLDQDNSLHYGSAHLSNDLIFSHISGYWDSWKKVLKIYGEIESVNQPPDVTTALVLDQMKQGKTDKLLCYEDITTKKGEESVQRAYRKHRLRYQISMKYEQKAAITILNQMIAKGKVIIHTDCQQLSIQLNTWKMEKNQPEIKGNGLARALLNVVFELRERRQLVEKVPMKPYSKAKQRIRARLKGFETARKYGREPGSHGMGI